MCFFYLIFFAHGVRWEKENPGPQCTFANEEAWSEWWDRREIFKDALTQNTAQIEVPERCVNAGKS